MLAQLGEVDRGVDRDAVAEQVERESATSITRVAVRRLDPCLADVPFARERPVEDLGAGRQLDHRGAGRHGRAARASHAHRPRSGFAGSERAPRSTRGARRPTASASGTVVQSIGIVSSARAARRLTLVHGSWDGLARGRFRHYSETVEVGADRARAVTVAARHHRSRSLDLSRRTRRTPERARPGRRPHVREGRRPVPRAPGSDHRARLRLPRVGRRRQRVHRVRAWACGP